MSLVAFLSARPPGPERRWNGLGPTPRIAALAAACAGAGAGVRLIADPAAHLPDEVERAVAAHLPAGGAAVVDVGAGGIPPAIARRLATRYLVVAVSSPAGAVLDAGDDAAVLAALGLDATGGWRWALPVPLLADCGLEVAHVAGGRVRALDPGRAAAVISGADRADQEGRHVRLAGGDLLDPAGLGSLVEMLRPRHLRVEVPLRAGAVNGRVLDAMDAASMSVVVVVASADDAAALTSALVAVSDRGLGCRVEAPLRPADDWVDELADAVMLAGVRLDWWPAPGVSAGDLALADATLARTGAGPSLAERIELPRLAQLGRLLGGRGTRGTARAGLGVVHVPDDEPVEAAGCATTRFGPAPGAGSGAGDRAGLVEADGAWLVDGRAVEVLPYRNGRHVEAVGPTVLRIIDRDDAVAFIADADRARSTGEIPLALRGRHTLLADACAWDAPGTCPTGRVSRGFVGDDGTLHTAPFGPAVGHRSDPHRVLLRGARRVLASTEADRGCATCPVAATCSRDTCLQAVVGDADYCAWRRERPWLPAWLDVIQAVRALDGGDGGRSAPRIVGFGWSQAAHGGRWRWPDRPPAVLVAVGADTFGWGVHTGKRFRLTPHAAVVAECVLGSACAGDAAAEVRETLAVDDTTAAAAVDEVAALLSARTARPPFAPASAPEPAGSVR